MTRMSLRVNTACRTTLDPIGIINLILDINSYTFTYNFIICKKLKIIIHCRVRLCTILQNWT